MLITADVYTRGGVIIVPENTTVTTEVLNLLAKHSIMEVIVGEEGATGSELELSLDDLNVLEGALGLMESMDAQETKQLSFEDTFHEAESRLEQGLQRLLNLELKDVYELLNIVDDVVSKADNNMDLFAMLFKMHQMEGNLYIHLLRVSIYAQLLAQWVSLPEDEIKMAGLAGLLHDAGLLICNKNGEKNITLHGEYDNKCGLNHMVYSHNLIQNLDVDTRLKQAVLTHHERMDLSGFPNKLSYKSLNNISRVLALADAYDTLTMEEEGYEAMQPLTALAYMFDTCYIRFDTEMMISFIQHLVQNFIQYEVILSNGQRGKIVMLNKKDPARPLIMVNGSFVDLSERKDITVVEMLC